MANAEENYLFTRPVLDFVRVSIEFCKYVEQCGDKNREEFIDVMRGLLPMLYLKASLLTEVPIWTEVELSHITEEDYDYIRNAVARVMGEYDDYLDVFVEDFKYSDRPVLRTVSEDLADLYQVLRELAEAYRYGHEDSMYAALHETREQFETYWGQTALNALRALHDARFGKREELEP